VTDTDDLLSKADALLAKWRAGAGTSGPPPDYPVLTDIIDTPKMDERPPVPVIPAEPPVPVIDSAATPGTSEVPELDSLEMPELESPPVSQAGSALLAPLAPADDFPRLLSLYTASDVALGESRSLEERIRLRVLEAVEPRIQAYLDVPLRHHLENLMRETAARVAAETREEIISVVREAVRTAVAEETESQQDPRPGGR
jgi:hypothetical protein